MDAQTTRFRPAKSNNTRIKLFFYSVAINSACEPLNQPGAFGGIEKGFLLVFQPAGSQEG